jgi:dimethylamine corrinoid protein
MTGFENEKKALKEAVVAYKVPGIKAAVDAARSSGMSAVEIIDTMGEGMSEVGVLFERGKLFLPHVLSAAAGMKAATEILTPELEENEIDGKAKGKIVIGTVEGDVHDIGKSICSTMLQCAGFEVHDMGRDVPNRTFVDMVRDGCNMCGMSALMTTTMTVQRDVIEIFKEEGLRDKVIVMVGGAPVTQAYADKIGADLYGETASETTRKAKEMEVTS